MAIENFGDGDLITMKAGEDLSSDQYRCVILSTYPTVIRPNATTDEAFGILQNAPTSGEAAIVAIGGISKVVLAETVATGEYVYPEYVGAADAGKVLDADGENQNAIGLCIEGGAAEGLGSILIIHKTVGVQTEAT